MQAYDLSRLCNVLEQLGIYFSSKTSRVWLQTEMDSTRSYYYCKLYNDMLFFLAQFTPFLFDDSSPQIG